MLQTEFSSAVNQICAERGISNKIVFDTIKTALLAAYRKDYGDSDIEELDIELDEQSGEARIYRNGKDVTPPGFGRIAAQTAKQVIVQQIREAERDSIIDEYKDKLGNITSGHVFRIEKGQVIIDLGRAQVYLPPEEQIPGEFYSQNQRLKVLIKEIREYDSGSRIIVSRTDPLFVRELFALEVPEIRSGAVSIKAISREPGERTKVAVSSDERNVDPVGSCVGRKGVRVQAVIKELNNEKIDIVSYSSDVGEYVANALSPASVVDLQVHKNKNKVKVVVPEDELSLAIGKEGQNVRLAAKLTGWKIDLVSDSGKAVSGDGDLASLDLSTRVENALKQEGVDTIDALLSFDEEALYDIQGVGAKSVAEIQDALGNLSQVSKDNQEDEDIDE